MAVVARDFSLGGAIGRPRAAVQAFLMGEIGRGTAVNLGFAIANSVLAIATSLFAGNALGPEGIGILSLGFLVLEFAGMIDNLGTGGFMRDYAGEPSPAKLATALRLKLALGTGTAVLMALLAPPLAVALDVPVGLLLLLAVIPATAILSSVATMVHEARRHAWRRNTAGTIEGAAKMTLYGAFWLTMGAGGNVHLFAWGAVIASAAGAAVGLLLLPSLRIRPWDRALALRYLAFGIAVQASGALSKTIFWSDILLVDVFLGHYQQGLYRTAYAVMAFVPLFAGTVGLFLFPAFSEAAHRNDLTRVRSLFRASFGYVLAIALPLILVVTVFATPALRFFGPGFVEADSTLRWLALISIAPALLVPFETLFPAMDHPWAAVRITGVMAVINVVLDLVLIPTHLGPVPIGLGWGVTGALVATGTAFAAGLLLALRYAQQFGVLGRRASG